MVLGPVEKFFLDPLVHKATNGSADLLGACERSVIGGFRLIEMIFVGGLAVKTTHSISLIASPTTNPKIKS
jgi:hypothetical protein